MSDTDTSSTSSDSGTTATTTATETTESGTTTGTGTTTTTTTTASTATTATTTTATTNQESNVRGSAKNKLVSFAKDNKSSSSSSDSDDDSSSDSDESSSTTTTSTTATTASSKPSPVPIVVPALTQAQAIQPVVQAPHEFKPKVQKKEETDTDSSDEESESTTTATTTTTTTTTGTSTSTGTSETTTATGTTTSGTTTSGTTTTTESSVAPKVVVQPQLQVVNPPPQVVVVRNEPQQTASPTIETPIQPQTNSISMKPPQDEDIKPVSSQPPPTSGHANMNVTAPPPTSSSSSMMVASNRYQDETSSETSEESESETSRSTSSSSSSLISQAEALAKPPKAEPTVVIRTVREVETMDFSKNVASPGNAYCLPVELMIDKNSSRDTAFQLCKRIFERQQSQQHEIVESSSELKRIPDAHLTRVNAFVALRAIGLSDTKSAALLFGSEETLPFVFVQMLVEREAHLIAVDRIRSQFRECDKFRSGELPRFTVLRLFERCGICDSTIADGSVDVRLNAGASPVIVVTNRAVDDPPQAKVVRVEANPRAFQMYVDQVRGEVTCNGVAVCSRITNAKLLSEVVQALQSCVYAVSMVDSNELSNDDSRTIAYENLLDSILAEKGPQILGATDSFDEAKKSLFHENLIQNLLKPLDHVDNAADASHIEPFLARSTASADQRRLNFVPQGLQLSSIKAPNNDGKRYFRLNIREVCAPGAPVDAVRYVIVSTVSSGNAVLPGVKVYAKPLNAGSDSNIWLFSKKKLNNSVFVSGDKSDTLYIEVCFDDCVATNNKPCSGITQCAGFAAATLEHLTSGSMAVKRGTFFRRISDKAEDESTSGGCFCFTSRPSTRIVVEATPLELEDLSPVLQQLNQPRIVILERHAKLVTVFHKLVSRMAEASSTTRALRSQAARAVLAMADQPGWIDQLSKNWDVIESSMSKDELQNADIVQQRLADTILKVAAVAALTDERNSDILASVLIDHKPLGFVKTGDVSPTFV